MAEQISVWQYPTAKGAKWAFEVRFPKTSTKMQRRGFASKAEALRLAKQARLDGVQLAQKPQSGLSINQLVEDYLASLRGSVREHTRANYKDLLSRYFMPVFGSKQVSEITEPMLSKQLFALRESGLLVGTVNTVRARMIGLFSYAVGSGFIASNPAARTRVQVETLGKTAVQAPLSPSEARALLQASKGTPLEIFITLTLGMGLRKGEALGLRWSDLNLAEGTVEIQRSRGQHRYLDGNGVVRSTESDGPLKTGSSRRILPISSAVMTALLGVQPHLETSGEDYLVSMGSGSPMALATVTREFRKLLKSSGVRHIRIHDLRHTAASIALEASAPLEAVSQALGHSGVEITKRIYAPKVRSLDLKFVQILDGQLNEDFFESENKQREKIN